MFFGSVLRVSDVLPGDQLEFGCHGLRRSPGLYEVSGRTHGKDFQRVQCGFTCSRDVSFAARTSHGDSYPCGSECLGVPHSALSTAANCKDLGVSRAWVESSANALRQSFGWRALCSVRPRLLLVRNSCASPPTPRASSRQFSRARGEHRAKGTRLLRQRAESLHTRDGTPINAPLAPVLGDR